MLTIDLFLPGSAQSWNISFLLISSKNKNKEELKLICELEILFEFLKVEKYYKKNKIKYFHEK